MQTTAIGQDRIRRLQRELRERGVAAMVCFKPENSFYLSGFNPIIYSHPMVAVLPAQGAPVVLVHALRDDHARAEAWVKDIRLYGAWGTKKTMGLDFMAVLGAILNECGVASGPLGIEEDFLPLTRWRQLERALPGIRMVNISDIIAKARLIKEPHEVECIRIACRIADAGMATAISAVAAGVSEREVSIAAMATMNRVWAQDYPDYEVSDFGSLEGGVHNGLWCWTLYGDRVAINTDNPTSRRPRPGELALILIWANANSHHAENERSVAIGALSTEQQRAFDAMLEIRARTAPLLKPGMPVKDVYLAAKAEYERLGYGPNTPGRIGHGMGLGAHEEPSMEAKSELVLQPNMVLTFEPNLRIPPWGGLQHSDTLLITETGHEFLTRTENGFIQV